MPFSHVLITRPAKEATALAGMLAGLAATPPLTTPTSNATSSPTSTPISSPASSPTSTPISTIIMPAYSFAAMPLGRDQLSALERAAAGDHHPVLIFTSSRAVEFGLPQVPAKVLQNARLAAIGPATASALEAAGCTVAIRPAEGFTSEDLLQELPADPVDPAGRPDQADETDPADEAASAYQPYPAGRQAPVMIFAAPGGRTRLADELQARGYPVTMMMVYRRQPADLAAAAVEQVRHADGLLSVWTSGNAMETLAKRLPADCWGHICAGDWLVISERLAQLAQAFGPRQVHLAGGPSNDALAASIRSLAERGP